MRDAFRDTGLVWSKIDHGFTWGWRHDHLLWAPYWLRKAIVHTVNRMMCKIYGHRVIGPFEDDGRVVVEKCCYMCCSKDV